MNISGNFKFRAVAISIALIASGFVSTGASNAVTVTPFTVLYNKNINGQVVVTGNTNMTCPTSKDALAPTLLPPKRMLVKKLEFARSNLDST